MLALVLAEDLSDVSEMLGESDGTVADVEGGMMDLMSASTSLGGGWRSDWVDDGWDVTEG